MAATMQGGGRGPRIRVSIWHALALIAIALACVFPFYWMVTTSLKDQAVALASPPVWLFEPTLDHYRAVLGPKDVGPSLLNSIIVAVSTTALAILLGTPAAYALARFEFRGKADLWFWFITNRMVSPIVLALPIFLLARSLNLIDTHLVLILLYLTFNLPIVVWICADQFRGIPRDLDDAARIDGASRFAVFLRIALPLAAPGVAVSAIFSFIFSWNELLYALVLTRSASRTAPVAATSFMSGYDLPWGEIMATGTLIVLPVIVFALIVSRQLVRGLTMGAVK
ncbi:multiple sugar transport system permease protein [Inquilinus ginsengisoli]|uniref:Maltose/maltodextrin transport system permease protein MalG n=1 Tax=Inquilinus ginsengisoli TaxID=363840 RepID=A0ABU1JN24_9PROT|nr:carbohydrate ABC transporter permease [Inquilinus ginsengisoli]MDR6289718.1 multiple sugar transport system permease protein [Inquilinus ginsengisoli]